VIVIEVPISVRYGKVEYDWRGGCVRCTLIGGDVDALDPGEELDVITDAFGRLTFVVERVITSNRGKKVAQLVERTWLKLDDVAVRIDAEWIANDVKFRYDREQGVRHIVEVHGNIHLTVEGGVAFPTQPFVPDGYSIKACAVIVPTNNLAVSWHELLHWLTKPKLVVNDKLMVASASSGSNSREWLKIRVPTWKPVEYVHGYLPICAMSSKQSVYCISIVSGDLTSSLPFGWESLDSQMLKMFASCSQYDLTFDNWVRAVNAR